LSGRGVSGIIAERRFADADADADVDAYAEDADASCNERANDGCQNDTWKVKEKWSLGSRKLQWVPRKAARHHSPTSHQWHIIKYNGNSY